MLTELMSNFINWIRSLFSSKDNTTKPTSSKTFNGITTKYMAKYNLEKMVEEHLPSYAELDELRLKMKTHLLAYDMPYLSLEEKDQFVTDYIAAIVSTSVADTWNHNFIYLLGKNAHGLYTSVKPTDVIEKYDKISYENKERKEREEANEQTDL